MYTKEQLVLHNSGMPPRSLDHLFDSSEELLDTDAQYLWFSTTETLAEIESAQDQLSETDQVVQFYSTDWISRFLSATPHVIQAAVGFTGLTAIKTELVRQVLSSSQPKSVAEFQIAIAQANDQSRVVEHPASSFALRSPIPAAEPLENRTLLSLLNTLPEVALVTASADSTTVTETMAGLLLIHDFLDSSHQYSQSVEGLGSDRNGDYWHGIMHRREPDFGNAKYWFRRVGDHPCFVNLSETAQQLVLRYEDEELRGAVHRLTSSGWDSIAAVDFFQQAHQPSQQGSDWHAFAEELQLSEMLIMLTHCCA